MNLIKPGWNVQDIERMIQSKIVRNIAKESAKTETKPKNESLLKIIQFLHNNKLRKVPQQTTHKRKVRTLK